MADIEIDIVGGGIEIDISPTDIEVEIESNDVDITLSRIGPQGPPGESSDIFFSIWKSYLSVLLLLRNLANGVRTMLLGQSFTIWRSDPTT